METHNIAVFEIPYPPPAPAHIQVRNRNCSLCKEKADYTCVEGNAHSPMCSTHGKLWASVRGLELPVRGPA